MGIIHLSFIRVDENLISIIDLSRDVPCNVWFTIDRAEYLPS